MFHETRLFPSPFDLKEGHRDGIRIRNHKKTPRPVYTDTHSHDNLPYLQRKRKSSKQGKASFMSGLT